MVVLITYDLNSPGQDYSELYKVIKSFGAWWHYLTSVWLVDTTSSPSTIAAKLREHIDKNDELFVIRVVKDYDGWLSQDAWDWIRERSV